MVGYDGGRVAGEGLADHVVVTRSEHIPRIQEAQASAYHALRELVGMSVAHGARALARAGAPRVRVRGHRPGRRLPPLRLPAGRRARAERFRAQRLARRAARGRGEPGAVAEFLARLAPDAPPLAVLERVVAEEREPTGRGRFAIRESPRGGAPDAPVAPDSATCDALPGELLDPGDRRFRYPFINCTNCGPRFTIVRGVPYDRPLTTMAALHHVRALPGRVRGSGRPPLPRAAQRLPAVRARR